jgi:hypothetical protein
MKKGISHGKQSIVEQEYLIRNFFDVQICREFIYSQLELTIVSILTYTRWINRKWIELQTLIEAKMVS